ncbi:unnamed protein product, partial [Meganyctiphanes norvegica]
MTITSMKEQQDKLISTPGDRPDSVDVDIGLEADSSSTLFSQSDKKITSVLEKDPDVEQARSIDAEGSWKLTRANVKNWKCKNICLIFIVCLLLFTIGVVLCCTLGNCFTLCSEADESSL